LFLLSDALIWTGLKRQAVGGNEDACTSTPNLLGMIRLEGSEKMYRHFHFVCNILRTAAGNFKRALDFRGFLLARDVLRKRHTQGLEDICSIRFPA